DRVYVHPFSL
nr:RecName: Full=Angiotensinogen; AltName: Full=Serpin A8; Contains: RecName: Full=Angiotensin-1; AltName: Full=Angiotensin I; Short=Ang I; Contains: RecName: Full=Angiotensin-2; AltName: Full=Angiotensin II; Short=Ang II; Contains: RecName: Full=Angiotensin-3; AltName: Full=Angiotensin III; Short=Ang III; AltName: Full=Des-Asp[1]-angiotensin II [Gallus gallus]P67886.1 RecName: Full=Angiotensinogen; AltName: Full=Serpin A8; Contains: RecName: Full=Angiotensin-1; AltName: Full=Angiotensin I; Short=